MTIVPRAVGLPFTASISLIAIAQFGSRASGPKKTANLAQTLDQLLKINQQLLRKNRYLMGEIAFVGNNVVNSDIPVRQVQTFHYLSEKNQQLQKEYQQVLGEVVAIRNKLVGPREACTKVKAEKITAKIAAWLFSRCRKGLR